MGAGPEITNPMGAGPEITNPMGAEPEIYKNPIQEITNPWVQDLA